MEPVLDEFAAVLKIFEGLPRQGPGDADTTASMLSCVTDLPQFPRVIDIGCGSGASTLVLARQLQTPIHAIDLCQQFLTELELRAGKADLSQWVIPHQWDMGQLDWPAGTVDLLWSEGAAYHLTFAGALETWRPLLAPFAHAVISEWSWFTDHPPEPALQFWGEVYPTGATESANCQHARQLGYTVEHIQRLAASAWWKNYYDPLQVRLDELKSHSDPVLQQVISGFAAEIAMFRDYGDSYGYTFYCLRRTD